MANFLQLLWRILAERPSTRIHREREALLADVRQRRERALAQVDPVVHSAPELKQEELSAPELKQEELSARVTTLEGKVKATIAKTDLLWKEHERRRLEDPFYCGDEKRLVDLGPPANIERKH